MTGRDRSFHRMTATVQQPWLRPPLRLAGCFRKERSWLVSCLASLQTGCVVIIALATTLRWHISLPWSFTSHRKLLQKPICFNIEDSLQILLIFPFSTPVRMERGVIALGDYTLGTIYPLVIHYGKSIGAETLQRKSTGRDLCDKEWSCGPTAVSGDGLFQEGIFCCDNHTHFRAESIKTIWHLRSCSAHSQNCLLRESRTRTF